MAYKINLKHRGSDVIEWIDLFDEASYGADKLFFRGRFANPDEVKTQVLAALGEGNFCDMETLEPITDDKLEEFKSSLGVGNPLATSPTEGDLSSVPTIALNRWHIPNKKFWNNAPPIDVINPYKASNAVTFSLRVHFYKDFGYITFGCPWSEIEDTLNDTETSSSIEKGSDLIPHFKLLQCHFISKEDAIQILNSLGFEGVDSWEKHAYQTQVLNLIDSDGSLIEI